MDTIRKVAVMCVARAVGFGTLAISCFMFALILDPAASFRSGAILALLMCGILLIKAHYVLHQKPRHTEAWLYLDERTRPHDDEADRRYVTVLRDVYIRFAWWTFLAACGLFAISALLVAVGVEFGGYLPMNR